MLKFWRTRSVLSLLDDQRQAVSSGHVMRTFINADPMMCCSSPLTEVYDVMGQPQRGMNVPACFPYIGLLGICVCFLWASHAVRYHPN